MKRSIKKTMRKSLKIFVAIIALIVIFIIAAFSASPLLNEYKPNVEHKVSKLVGLPVTIKNIRLSWHTYKLGLALDKVVASNKDNPGSPLKIKKIVVLFSVIESLKRRELAPSGFVISGAKINLIKTKDNNWTLEELPKDFIAAHSNPDSPLTLNSIMDLTASQPDIILHHIDIHYPNQRDEKIKDWFTIDDFTLENNNEKHELRGNGESHQSLKTDITFSLNWQGARFELDKIKADLYLNVTGLPLLDWQNQLKLDRWQIKEGIASAKIWAKWQSGGLSSLQGTAQTANTKIYSDTSKKNYALNRLTGRFNLEHVGDDLTFKADDIFVDLPNHLWPVNALSLKLQKTQDAKWQARELTLEYLDLKDLRMFQDDLKAEFSKDVATLLFDKNLSGYLEKLHIVFAKDLADWPSYNVDVVFKNIDVDAGSDYPGVKNLSGRIAWNNDKGQIEINSKRFELEYPKLFWKSIFLTKLKIKSELQLSQDKKWQINISKMKLNNDDLDIQGKGDIVVLPEKSPQVDFSWDFSMKNAKRIAYYLPINHFKPDLSAWLKTAFSSGEISQGKAILKGDINDFPFDENKGTFYITGQLNDVNFEFAPDWPRLKKTSGRLTFINDKMLAEIDKTMIKNIAINHLTAEIPKLDEHGAVIIKDVSIHSELQEGVNFVNDSPLKTSVGRVFKDATLTGPLNLTLSLNVPLDFPDKTKVQGNLLLKDATFKAKAKNIAITNLMGELMFTDSIIKSKNLKGILFSKPISFTLDTITKNKTDNEIQTKFNYQFNIKDWHEILPASLSKLLTEEIPLNGVMSVSSKESMNVMLYAKLLGGNLQLSYLPSGWSILGDFNQFDAQKIMDNMDFSASKSGESFAFNAIKLNAKKFLLSGHVFSDFMMNANTSKSGWNIDITSQEAKGKITLPPVLSKDSLVTIKFDTLTLQGGAAQKAEKSKINLNTLPRINLQISRLTFQKMRLGSVFVDARPASNGLNLSSVRLISNDINLNAQGSWTQKNGYDNTELKGKLTSPNVSRMLINFGVDAHNFQAAAGNMTFDLTWQNPFYSPSLASLSGTASFDIGKGRILDLGQNSGAKIGIGRLLNIFSLQSIPRRLSFDFSDLFQKGYSFDSIKSDLKLDNGNVYTKNLRFDGSIAAVNIDGRIGLADQTLDFILSVKPNVTSSIPVAATLVGGPIVGLAAFAVNTVIGSTVSKVTANNYHVTGTWEKPEWKDAGKS